MQRHLRIATCLVSLLLAFGAAAGRNDIDFYPSFGAPQGGTVVHLRGASFYTRFTAPQVFFDGVLSPQITLVDAYSITAVTPPHVIGIVPVTVVDQGAVLESLSPFVFEPELEEIVIPIALKPVDAAYGTRWSSEISVYNDSDESISIDPEICYSLGSPRLCSRPARRVAPHSTLRIEPYSDWAGSPHMFVRPPADRADRLHFSVRLHELSRNADGPGTEIPVVRARDFQRTQVWLSSVPIDARFRSTLRVLTRGASVTVRVSDETSGAILWERVVSRPTPTDIDWFGTVTMAGLLSEEPIRGHERVRIEVQSGSPVWALLTLTDNETQRVHLFTPQ